MVFAAIVAVQGNVIPFFAVLPDLIALSRASTSPLMTCRGVAVNFGVGEFGMSLIISLLIRLLCFLLRPLRHGLDASVVDHPAEPP